MTAKRGQKRRHYEELWQQLVFLAFHTFLMNKHSVAVERETRKAESDNRQLLLAAMCDDDDKRKRKSTVVEKFRLPWMPQRSVVPELLAILQVAKAISDVRQIRTLCAVGQLTELRLPGVPSDDSDIADALQLAFETWADEFCKEESQPTPIRVKVASGGTNGLGRQSDHSARGVRNNAEKLLREGHAVVLLSLDLARSDRELAKLSGQTLTPGPLCRQGMLELVRFLHVPSKGVDDAYLLDRFPPDKALASKSATQIEAALRQKRVEDMLVRLNQTAPKAARRAALTLDDVHGQDAAVNTFKRILADVDRWRDGELDWSDVSASAVMFGPPGNGKTMIAEAVAGSANLPFVATSYSECQSKGHQGEMLKALAAAFDAAKDEAPSVLFIDEIDSFSKRGADNHNDSYIRGVVNGLLTEVSRAVKTPGVILLAATNDLSVVDPAVVRPGRFDLKIPVLNPDLNGIRSILLHHLGADSLDAAEKEGLNGLARELAGMSGAGVAALARQALGLARAEGRNVRLVDISAAIGTQFGQADFQHLRRIAIHEAGHAVARIFSSLPNPKRIQIGQRSGYVEAQAPTYYTADTVREELRILFAGRAAEKVCLGSISSGAGEGAESDLALATLLALKAEAEWNLESAPQPWSPANVMMSVGIPAVLKAKVAEWLAEAEREAVNLVSMHVEKVRGLAGYLMEKREASQGDILAVVLGYEDRSEELDKSASCDVKTLRR